MAEEDIKARQKAARAQRLETALRANLRRRKAQSRLREGGAAAHDGGPAREDPPAGAREPAEPERGA